MDLRQIQPSDKNNYNQAVTHIIQSFEWGEFRRSIGLPLLRYGLFEKGKLKSAFQLTLHKIPFTSKFVGYLPKGPAPTLDLAEALIKIGKDNDCAFIKIEPNVQTVNYKLQTANSLIPSPKPMFTKFNFIINLAQTEEKLLKNMHPKTRYNIRVAQKKGVKIEERLDDNALEIYLKLYFETTARQNYHGHNREYHKKVWGIFKKAKMARLLIATYKKTPISAWLLLNFKDTLYYPYGGSSMEYREVMANNLIAWEAIKLGKRLKLNTFDMWGALGPVADPKDPWFGFHRFKAGYGGKLVEYIGTYDLVFNALLYNTFTSIDRFTKLKVLLLKLIGK